MESSYEYSGRLIRSLMRSIGRSIPISLANVALTVEIRFIKSPPRLGSASAISFAPNSNRMASTSRKSSAFFSGGASFVALVAAFSLAVVSVASCFACRFITTAKAIQPIPIVNIGSVGNAVKISNSKKTPEMINASGREKICPRNCPEKFDFCVLRVVSNAAANEIKNAGTWLTNPSPIVNFE